MTTEIIGYMADPMAEEKAEKKRVERVKKELYFTRQRTIGLIALIVGIIAPVISTEGIIASILLIPYGTLMVLNNNKMITEEEGSNGQIHKI